VLFIDNYEKCSFKERFKTDLLVMAGGREDWFRKICQTYWPLFKKLDIEFSRTLIEKISSTLFKENETLAGVGGVLKQLRFDTFASINADMTECVKNGVLTVLHSSKWR
jgi:hypothetical protein